MVPQIPKQVSSNGEELWDWAGKFSQHVHLFDRKRVLQHDLRQLKNECGSCRYWMTSDCPLEKSSMTGYKQGPSMGAPICHKFVMGRSSIALQEKWEAELVSVEKQLSSPLHLTEKGTR